MKLGKLVNWIYYGICVVVGVGFTTMGGLGIADEVQISKAEKQLKEVQNGSSETSEGE